MTNPALAAAVAILAVACGAYAGPGAGSSPTPGGGVGYDVVATENDQAITMRAGQKLEVVLRAPNGMSNWTHPTSSDTSVLAPIVDPAATAARYVTLAAFEARRSGRSEVSATASPLCSPGQACPMFVALYSLKVTVTP